MGLYDEFHRFHVVGVPDRLRISEPSTPTEQAALSEALSAILHREDAAMVVAVVGDHVVGLAEVYVRQDEPHPLVFPARDCSALIGAFHMVAQPIRGRTSINPGPT